jgi:hypothetical protein
VIAGSVSEISGKVKVKFTDSIEGAKCPEDAAETYPGTGATFQYTVARSR